MKIIRNTIFMLAIVLVGVSCAVLKPVTVYSSASLGDYKYVYITPTSGLTSSAGSVYGGSNGVYGSSVTKSVNPGDIISGALLKLGYIILPKIEAGLRDKTVIVNYGESGRRNVLGGLAGYTIEVTMQFLSAQTHEQICIVTAEGQGETEADDIRIAINRCLESVFE